jgi:hypothetical protein
MLFVENQGEEGHEGIKRAAASSIIPRMPGNVRFTRRLLGLVILTLSSGLFLWGVWPFPVDSVSTPIPSGPRMVLVWPVTTRIGDAYSVRMQIEPLSSAQPELASTALFAGDANSNLMASARLEFAVLLTYPGEQVSQPLLPGNPLAFRWQFRPETRGDYTGVAWLYLLDVPLDGSPETVTPVSAREIRIRAVDLFGLNGPAARLLGGSGILVGGLLGLDGVFARLLKRFRPRARLHPAPEFVEQ